ncbi:hypothetical protein ACFFK0_12790 [Paenibacillus chartarius]|uniref:Transposase n=1 Tax=Paenibacillus chartarius TaxID=747481 RepID=A0ABV6DL39_9BACL
MNEPKMKKPMDTLEFLRQDAAAKTAYNARMKALSDEKSRIEGAMQEGRTVGIEEVKAKIAAKLLAMGMDIQIVAEATELSVEEIQTLNPLH